MEKPARLFSCAHCHTQVIICSDCDSGQIYCSQTCSQTARRVACRATDARYQKTRQGKLKHAARQRRYRQRLQQKKEIVTDQSSLENTSHDVLPVESDEVNISPSTPLIEGTCCHFCKKTVSDFLRYDFLGSDRGNSLTTKYFRTKNPIKFSEEKE